VGGEERPINKMGSGSNIKNGEKEGFWEGCGAGSPLKVLVAKNWKNRGETVEGGRVPYIA